ncbi:MAG: insulinase family protein [Planctomycetaceae bacterium]|nr:insulinase family protein [Planctomycetaceae bacterium]
MSLHSDGVKAADPAPQTQAAASGAPALPEGIQKGAVVEGISEFRLANGLKVLLFPDPSKPTVTVNLTLFVGSRHEGYGETGMAHLLEHMVFKGTPTHQQIPKLLQDRGAVFNGTTSTDRTNYFETLPAGDENLEFALTLEADRMVNSTIRAEDLASEFTVVRNEFERGENSPAAILIQRMNAVAYEWHNYGKRTIGNRTDIERVPIDNLIEFYRRFYQPDNALLIIAGKFDESRALALVKKTFGALPSPERKLRPTYTEEPPQDGERTVTLRRVGDTGMVGLVYHIPSGSHVEFATLQVLNSILTTDVTGRLYKELVETKLAASVGGFCSPGFEPGTLTVLAEVKKGDSIDAARDALIANVEKLAETGVTDEEVNRAKQRLLKQWELQLSNATQLAVGLSNWAAQGDWRLFFLYRDRLEQVTAADVRGAAEKYLTRSNRTVGLFIPSEKPERSPVPSRPDVAPVVAEYKGRAQVAAGEAFDVSPANVESRTRRLTIDGIKVALLPKKTRDNAVRAVLSLRYGNVDNLRGTAVAADILPTLMLRGTQKLDRQQFNDELDRLKSQITAGGSTAQTVFSVQTRRGTLPEVIELLRQALREPALPAEDFDVIKRQLLADLDGNRTDPQILAPNLLQRQLFSYSPEDVRYTPTIPEQIDRTLACTIDQVRTLHSAFLGSQAGELAIVGDFDPDEVLPLVRAALAGWKGIQPYARIAEPVSGDVKPTTAAIATPDKANAVYAAGIAFPLTTADPDYPGLVIGNFVLGSSGLSSRLGNRIRQKEGLSYGVRSSFSASHQDEHAELQMSAICNPTNMGKVQQAALEELQKLVGDGPTEQEMAAATQGYLQTQQVRRADDSLLASLLNSTSYNGQTMKFYTDLELKIARLTSADVKSALEKHVNPKKLTVISAGDFPATASGGK